ncbi:ABC transporter ATP-binding protein [Olsenella uli]|uniref:ABC transporter ATP-binding protein n=1 Tax=Olsenella uli TaxID=133926 RepID=UPI00325FAA2F
MPDLLKIQGLTKSYGDFSLQKMELSVPDGHVVGLIGKNGAGKSTTMKAILGLIFPDAGHIELFGRVDDDGPCVEVKRRIGVVLDSCPFPAEMTAADVGRLGRRAFGSWRQGRFDTLLRDAGISATKKVRRLSRGMGMRLQLAFALAHEPDLLLLDEATSGLDPLARDEVLDLLRDHMSHEGRGILMSSHITTDLEKLADIVVCIDGGCKVFEKTLEDICDTSGIARCKSGDVERIMRAGLFGQGVLRILRNGYSSDVLVPDRKLLHDALPTVTCERASLDEYMLLTLKGEAL